MSVYTAAQQYIMHLSYTLKKSRPFLADKHRRIFKVSVRTEGKLEISKDRESRLHFIDFSRLTV
jgi:hypothetical protein